MQVLDVIDMEALKKQAMGTISGVNLKLATCRPEQHEGDHHDVKPFTSSHDDGDSSPRVFRGKKEKVKDGLQSKEKLKLNIDENSRSTNQNSASGTRQLGGGCRALANGHKGEWASGTAGILKKTSEERKINHTPVTSMKEAGYSGGASHIEQLKGQTKGKMISGGIREGFSSDAGKLDLGVPVMRKAKKMDKNFEEADAEEDVETNSEDDDQDELGNKEVVLALTKPISGLNGALHPHKDMKHEETGLDAKGHFRKSVDKTTSSPNVYGEKAINQSEDKSIPAKVHINGLVLVKQSLLLDRKLNSTMRPSLLIIWFWHIYVIKYISFVGLQMLNINDLVTTA